MRFAKTSPITDDGRPLSKRNALAQGFFEFDLAVHGAGGNARDEIAKSGHVGQFVDAFLLDHGGIHVGDQHLLAPRCGLLHSKIDAAPCQERTEFGHDGIHGNTCRQGQVAGDARRKPVDFSAARKPCRGCRERFVENGIFRIGNQGSQQVHSLARCVCGAAP